MVQWSRRTRPESQRVLLWQKEHVQNLQALNSQRIPTCTQVALRYVQNLRILLRQVRSAKKKTGPVQLACLIPIFCLTKFGGLCLVVLVWLV